MKKLLIMGIIALFTVFNVSVLFLSNTVFAVEYEIIDLGTLGGNAYAYGINDYGQIVGTSDIDLIVPYSFRGFLYENNAMTNLGTLGGINSAALDINNNGQVVGYVRYSSAPDQAFMYKDGIINNLGTLDGYYGSYANAINESGQIVGYVRGADAPNVPGRAFLLQDSTMIDLGSLGGNYSHADDINDNGQIVGLSTNASGVPQAFLYENGIMTDIYLVGKTSQAHAINNSGQIVGEFEPVNSIWYHAFFYDNGIMTDLGTLGMYMEGGVEGSYAWDINDNGQIVGSTTTPTVILRAFLYDNGVMMDLGSLSPTGSSSASAINNRGQIVGWADTSSGVRHAVLWNPVVVPMNNPPDLDFVGSRWVYEGSLVSFTLTATDVDGDPVVFDAVNLPSGAYLDGNTGEFIWTPSHSQAGRYDVTFIATDGDLEDSEIVTITVFDGDGGGSRIFQKKVAKKKAEGNAGKQVATFSKTELNSTFDVEASFLNLDPENADVTVTTFETCPKSPLGFEVGDMCFDLTTDAKLFDSVEICVTYDETTVTSENALKLMHYKDNKWVNITTTLVIEKNVICGTATSLSPFAVFGPDYTFIGFLQPIENQPVTNTARAGRTIPVRWQIVDEYGAYISDLNAVTGIWYQATQCSGTSVNEMYETNTSGSSGLRYDMDANQFIYTWQTEKNMTGCYSLILELYGLDRHETNFELK